MNRLSIGQRIAASFAFLVLPIALFSIYFLSQQADLFRSVRFELITEKIIGEMRLGFSELLTVQTELHQAIREENSEDVSQIVGANELEISQFVSAESLEQSGGFSPLLTAKSSLEGDILAYNSALAKVQLAAGNGNWEEAGRILNNDIRVITDKLETGMQNFSDTVVNLNGGEEDFLQSLSETQSSYVMRILFGAVMVIGTILVIGTLLTFSIAIPLNQIKEGLLKWQAGDLTQMDQVWGNSELSDMSEMFNKAISSVSERHKRDSLIQPKRLVSSSLMNDHIHVLETSLTIAQHAASVRDLENLLPRLIEILRQRYDLYHVAVYLIEDQTDLLVLEAGSLINDKRKMPVNEKSLPGWVAKHLRPGLAENVKEDVRYYESNALPNTRSELALPLMVGNLFLGVLDLHNASQVPFNRDHVLQFQSIADLIAMSVRNLQIIEGGRARLHLADALKGIGEELVASSNLPNLFSKMLRHLDTLIDYDGAAVLLWDGKMLEVNAAYKGILVRKGSKITPDYNDKDDVFMHIQDLGRPYAIDLPKSKSIPNRWRSLFLDGCWLGIPFLAESGRIAGFVCFSRLETESFTAEDRSIATTIINQSWLALENVQQKQKISRLQDQMEFEMRNRTDAVQQAYADLDRLDQTKSRFVSIASHELKTPITIIRGYGEILQKKEKIQNDPQNKRIVDGILKGVSRINELVENLLDLTRIDYRTLEIRPEPIRMKDLFDSIKNFFDTEITTRQLTLTFDDSTRNLPIIDADLVGIRKIFEHLVNNAIKYTPDGGEIRISANSWLENPPNKEWPSDGIQVSIQDTGIGIEAGDINLIFEKFFQISEIDLHSTSKVEFRGGGPGLGLAIVRGIVTAHNGQVWAESPGYDEDALPGSTFHIVLPRRQTPADARPLEMSYLNSSADETVLTKALNV